ncbi:MAG TPA: glycosyltransferase family 4 protein [Candidatus Binatia bacterium]
MKIAQVAPLYERVPPISYGGTERIVSYLTEELVTAGHDVTLFASGDSLTKARLVAPCPRALRLCPDYLDCMAYNFLELEQVFQAANSFDLIHFHTDYFHFPFSRRQRATHVTTLHGRLDIPDLVPLYREFSEMPVISISNAQRGPLPWANWQKTIYHGLPLDLLKPQLHQGRYLAFLGRISPEKRVDRAIGIAKLAGMKLKIAAKIDKADLEYFDRDIRQLLDDPVVEFIGEIGDEQKQDFLGNASALLFPIDWPEPFGLVMIEAMACGTPVIAFRRGSVAEIIDEGVTGFIVEGIDEAVHVLERIDQFDRKRCRRTFEERFSVARMARDYVAVYEQLLAARKPKATLALRKKTTPAEHKKEISPETEPDNLIA